MSNSELAGKGGNYWEWAAKELEEEKQMLLQQLADSKLRAEEAERLLHDLTPMGSEFVGDPKRCFDWVQEHTRNLHRLLCEKTVARREAEQALATEQAGARRRQEQTVLGVARRWRDDASVWPELQMVIDDLAALEGGKGAE